MRKPRINLHRAGIYLGIVGIYVASLIGWLTSLPYLNTEWRIIPTLLGGLFAILILAGFGALLVRWYSYTKGISIQVTFDREEALSAGREVFALAAESGGTLYSTHIYPQERLHQEAILDTLKKAKYHLDFRRILFTDDPVKLDHLIAATLAVGSKEVSVEVLVPYSSSSVVPKFLWYILPRINVLTYIDRSGGKARTVIGLFRIYTEQNTSRSSVGIPTSPTLDFRTNRVDVAEKVIEYLRAFDRGQYYHIKSIEEYEAQKHRILFQKNYRSFIDHILTLCNNPSLGLLHCSLFGQCALFERGVQDIGTLKTDLDVDLLIVCKKGKREAVREEIKAEAATLGFKTTITWGPSVAEFYSRRSGDTFSVDIEIFEEGDDFYELHPLLGLSIIPSCTTIYLQDPEEDRLHKLLVEPRMIVGKRLRADVVLRDRKGIRDFIKSVPKYKDTLDPIRVISHIVRNLAWVVTGSFPASYERAVEIVYSDQDLLFDKQSLEVADKMIKLRDIHTHDDQLSSIECLLKDAERDLEHLAAGGELH